MVSSSRLQLRRSFTTRFRLVVAALGLAAAAWFGLQVLKAAPVQTEAETLSLSAGSGKVFADATASAGNGLMVWSNATATGQVNLPATNRITVRAKGDQCNGAPQMVIKVDDAAVLTSTVAGTAWTDYSAAVNLPTGAHRISVAFTNDALAAGCDRNLRVDKLNFAEAPSVPAPTHEAENASLPPSAGKVFSDASASASKGLIIWSNATATLSVNVPESGRLEVRARGDQCGGAPDMVVRIDGNQVLATPVAATNWTDYGVNVPIAAGVHQVAISFTNDAIAAGCDRNLRIDKLSFTSAVSNPPPVVPPQPIPPPPVGTGTSGNWNTYKGFNFTGWCNDCWSTAPATTSFNAMANMGGNSVALPVYWYQDSKYSNSMQRTGNTTSDAALVGKIQQAKAKGLKVMIRPIMDTKNNGGWRGMYQPSNKTTWFANYRTVINHYAVIAQAHGVDILEVGSEFNTLQDQDAEWRRVAAEARARYGGKLTYAANWDVFQNVNWYDAVDLISVDAYFPLGRTSEGTLSEETILSRWTNYNGRNIVGEISAVQARFGKPVIFGELGYASRSTALESPWDGSSGGTYAGTLQQNALNAALKAFDNKPWFHGAFLWHWSYDPNAGGTTDTDHTPQRKPAEATIRERFLGAGGPIVTTVGSSDQRIATIQSAVQSEDRPADQPTLAAASSAIPPTDSGGSGGSGSATPTLNKQADVASASTLAARPDVAPLTAANTGLNRQHSLADTLVASSYASSGQPFEPPFAVDSVSGMQVKDSPLAGLYLQNALSPTATRSLFQAAGLAALLGLLALAGPPAGRRSRGVTSRFPSVLTLARSR